MSKNNVQTLTGTNLKFFMNGTRMGLLSKLSIKVTGKTEDVPSCGTPNTGTNVTGFSISGTATVHKKDSFMIKDIISGLKGETVMNYQAMGVLTDPITQKSERYLVSGIVFTELEFSGEEQKGIDQDYAFNAYDIEVSEGIN